MPTVNEKFKGLGKKLYQALPEDVADANAALARAFGQIKNIFDQTPQTVGTTAKKLETLKGLDLLDNSTAKLDDDTINFYKNTLGTGSGANGEMLLVDLLGTAAGWVVSDELNAETARLQELDKLGEFDLLQAWPEPKEYDRAGNGLYTVLYYHWVDDAYYTPIVNPFDPTDVTPQWTIPANITSTYSKRGVYGSKAALSNAVTELVNDEIERIANKYPLHAAQSRAAYERMALHIQNEKQNWTKAAMNPETTIAGSKTPVNYMIQNLHSIGLDTSLGGSAWIFEQLADRTTKGGQAIIGAMREGRNIERLAAIGIPTTGSLVGLPKTTEQATLSSSEYTIQEAKDQTSL